MVTSTNAAYASTYLSCEHDTSSNSVIAHANEAYSKKHSAEESFPRHAFEMNNNPTYAWSNMQSETAVTGTDHIAADNQAYDDYYEKMVNNAAHGVDDDSEDDDIYEFCHEYY